MNKKQSGLRTNGGPPTERRHALIAGEGFSLDSWVGRFEATGLSFGRLDLYSEEDIARERHSVIIETEDIRLHEWFALGGLMAPDEEDFEGDDPHDHEGHGHHLRAMATVMNPDIATEGVIFLPCYAAPATDLASVLELWEGRAVGYTLFPKPPSSKSEKQVIEMTRAMQTTDEAWERALKFVEAAGLRAEIVGDAPGLVFGRTIACLVNEASLALSEGIASAKDIDSAMQLGVNYPKGLFAWADELGVELIVDILEGLEHHYREDRYRTSPLLQNMVTAGKSFSELELPPTGRSL